MSNNPILDELHATREKLLAEAGGDLHRYVEEARKRALASGRPIAEITQRRIRNSSRLSQECTKLDPQIEKQLAEEGMTDLQN